MNTNSNTYTVIYSIILVVVVAAVLAFVAKFLQPMQDDNVKKDTISQILTAAGIEYTEDNVLDVYKENIEKAIVVKVGGNEWKNDELKADEKLEVSSCQIYTNSKLKEQTVAADADKKLPVFIFKNGITVVPCYGAGLWGPIWGYIGIKDNTITSVCFGHKGETPGLGAKISDDPEFAKKFVGQLVNEIKVLDKKDTVSICFEIAKPGNRKTADHGVDAISGATITSQALGKALDKWFGLYKEYLLNVEPVKTMEE